MRIFGFFLFALWNSLDASCQQAILKIQANNGIVAESVNALVLTNNAATASLDRLGNNAALYFNGSSSYVTTPHDQVLDLDSSDFTLCVWAKFDTTETFSRNAYVLVQKGHTGTTHPQFILRYLKNSKDIQLLTNDLNQSYLTTTLDAQAPNFEDANWHHIVATRSSNKMEIFLDGLSIGNKTVSSVDVNSAGAFTIGAQNPDLSSTSFHNFFAGDIGEVLMFKDLLSTSQIANHCEVEGPNSFDVNVNQGDYLRAMMIGKVLKISSDMQEPVKLRILSSNGILVFDNFLSHTSTNIEQTQVVIAPGVYILQASFKDGSTSYSKLSAFEGVEGISFEK